MEDRVLLALVLILALLAGGGWVVVRQMSKRRNFKIRQSGRGKSVKPAGFEPAE